MRKEVIEVFESDGGFIVRHSKATGISAYGDTIEEAFKEFGIAFQMALEVMKEDGIEDFS